MKRSSLGFQLLVLLFAALAVCLAHSASAQQSEDARAYPQEELDQLLAPIALYPDDLLTQILVASTYPLEVVEAARFVGSNPGLRGDALDDAVAKQNWDASVQSLTAFPQVLAMMDDKLEWTERLGDAFLADEQRVMDTVQSLRRRAQGAGNLASTPQQSVVVESDIVVIEPAQPEVVYVPVYDPLAIYGAWWAPGYPPWFWYPPPIYGYPPIITGIAFGIGWVAGVNHRGWCRPDWRGHHVILEPGHNRFWDRPNRPHPAPGQAWQHSPFHRRGVPYADAQTRDRFQPVNPGAIRERQDYRGYVPPAAQRGAGEPGRAQAAPQSRSASPGAAAPRQSLPPANPAQRAPVTRPPISQPQAPVVRQPPQAPVARQQPQPPVVRMPQVSPRPGASRSAPSVFDPGASRSHAQINAQRGMESLRSSPPPAAPVLRAPAPPRAAPAGQRGR